MYTYGFSLQNDAFPTPGLSMTINPAMGILGSLINYLNNSTWFDYDN